MFLTCAEEGWWMLWTKNVAHGVARKEENHSDGSQMKEDKQIGVTEEDDMEEIAKESSQNT